MAKLTFKKGNSILSKNIGGSGRSSGKYPDKTTINLIRNENAKANRLRLILYPLLILAVVLFLKFAVYDQIAKLQRAQQEYMIVQDQLISLQQYNARYDEVKAKYDDVTEWYMTDEEKLIPDKMDIIEMLEEDLMPFVKIRQVQVSGHVVTVQTGEANLETVAKFLQKLQTDKRNSSATVTTTSATNAGNTKKETVTASVIIYYTGGIAQENTELDAEARAKLLESAGLTEEDLAGGES